MHLGHQQVRLLRRRWLAAVALAYAAVTLGLNASAVIRQPTRGMQLVLGGGQCMWQGVDTGTARGSSRVPCERGGRGSCQDRTTNNSDCLIPGEPSQPSGCSWPAAHALVVLVCVPSAWCVAAGTRGLLLVWRIYYVYCSFKSVLVRRFRSMCQSTLNVINCTYHRYDYAS